MGVNAAILRSRAHRRESGMRIRRKMHGSQQASSDQAKGWPMSYRSPADGFRTCYRCGADLAEGASFCPNCGATQRLRVRRQAQRRPQWLPFAVVGAGIAAIAVGALLAVLLGDRPDGVAEDAKRQRVRIGRGLASGDASRIR